MLDARRLRRRPSRARRAPWRDIHIRLIVHDRRAAQSLRALVSTLAQSADEMDDPQALALLAQTCGRLRATADVYDQMQVMDITSQQEVVERLPAFCDALAACFADASRPRLDGAGGADLLPAQAAFAAGGAVSELLLQAARENADGGELCVRLDRDRDGGALVIADPSDASVHGESGALRVMRAFLGQLGRSLQMGRLDPGASISISVGQ